MMEPDVSKSVPWKRLWPWALLVVVVVLVPLLTFGRSLLGLSGRSADAETETPVVTSGTAYTVREAFVLKPGSRPDSADVHVTPEGPVVSSTEVVAPSPDGSKVWVVDHPLTAKKGARIRRFSVDGRLELTFEGRSANLLFTPGLKNDLWAIASSGTGDQKLVHYDAKGKMVRDYTIPPGVRCRSISIDPDGEVWVQQEEWYLDPDTNKGSYTSSLIPIVEADGDPVPDLTPEKAAEGSFLGPDDRMYTLQTSDGTRTATNDYLPFYAVARDQQGERVSEYDVTDGGRPYAADSAGRVYSEKAPQSGTNIPGQSGLGDAAFGWVTVAVYSVSGEVSYIPVTRDSSRESWVPSAWPASDGRVFSSRWDDDGIHILVSTPSEERAPQTSGKPRKPDASIVMPSVSPRSGDPYLALDVSERDLWQSVYSGLVSRDASLNVVADLAESVPKPGDGISEDGLTIQWKIRSGRTWHDGRPVTAADVVATWKHLQQPTTVPRSEPFPGFRYIKSVSAAGDTVRVTLKQPYGPAPESFFPYVLPEHVVGAANAQINGGLHARPVGCGPYRVDRWTARSMTLVAAAKGEAGPSIPTIEVVFAPEGPAQAFTDIAGPAYWMGVSEADASTMRQADDVDIETYATGRTFGLVVNEADSMMKSRSVRSAMLGTYPSSSVRDYYGFESAPTVTPFISAATRADTYGQGEKANARFVRELVRLGYRDKKDYYWLVKDGSDVGVRYTQGMRGESNHETVSEVEDEWVRSLRNAKVILEFENGAQYFYDAPSAGGFLSRGRHQVASVLMPGFMDAGWGSVFDPADTPSWSNQRGVAVTFTQDEELRDLHERTRASYDPAERARLSGRIVKRVRDLGLVHLDRPEMRNSASKGIDGLAPAMYPAGEFHNIEEWTLR